MQCRRYPSTAMDIHSFFCCTACHSLTVDFLHEGQIREQSVVHEQQRGQERRYESEQKFGYLDILITRWWVLSVNTMVYRLQMQCPTLLS
jgi:hypothetical protein